MNMSDMNATLQPIRDRFLGLLQGRLEDIRINLERALEQPEDSAEALSIIESILHKIAGTAGTLGYTEMGEKARVVEDRIIQDRANDHALQHKVYLDVIDFLEISYEVSERAA